MSIKSESRQEYLEQLGKMLVGTGEGQTLLFAYVGSARAFSLRSGKLVELPIAEFTQRSPDHSSAQVLFLTDDEGGPESDNPETEDDETDDETEDEEESRERDHFIDWVRDRASASGLGVVPVQPRPLDLPPPVGFPPLLPPLTENPLDPRSPRASGFILKFVVFRF